MASLHRNRSSKFWIAAFRGPDGRRHFRSTRTADRRQAEEIARGWEQVTLLARAGKLTPEAARGVVARTVQDLYLIAHRSPMPVNTVRECFQMWCKAKMLEAARTTALRYQTVARRFLKFLGPRADKDIALIDPKTIIEFRDAQARELSAGTANYSVKTIRACFNMAIEHGLATNNPARVVGIIKQQQRESRRRGFTVPELERLLQACGDTPFRTLVTLGLYTGQRLGDVMRMTWDQIDFKERTVSFLTRKTGRRMIIPMAMPLEQHLRSLPVPADATEPIFPKFATARTGTVSTLFHDRVLAPAGLAPVRSHHKGADGDGRDGPRVLSPLSFHSLRHSATTLLKAAGASDVIAREIIGHDSEVVSRQYTHLGPEALRGAIDRLPDVTCAPASSTVADPPCTQLTTN
ncbi:MAG: tyrosine-type recombinase/integrase [Verrucomicrobiae bacterium]|nr:tyrosine-type recombinase/integrase [Verrucomicrobiae bacterium]